MAETWNSGVTTITNQVADDIPNIKENLTFLANRFGYLVDPTETDQGSAGNGRSIKDFVDSVGSTKKATLFFPHYADDGNTTTYTLDTSETMSSNFFIDIQPGAQIAIATGVTLTIEGGFKAGLTKCFALTGTGAVSFSSNLISRVHPQWFGAVANGSTDDQAAIQAAITAAGKIPVSFPYTNSAYQVESSIALGAYTSLIGEGQYSTNIRATGDVDIITGSAISGVYLENLLIVNQSPAGDCQGISFNDVHNWTIVNCSLSNHKTGIKAIESYIGGIDNTIVQNCDDYGIHIEDAANNIVINRCVVANNDDVGIYIKGATSGEISGRNIAIRDCDIEFNDGYQIVIKDTYDITIDHNYFEENATSDVLYDIYVDMDTYPSNVINIINNSFSRNDTGAGSGNIYADNMDVLNIKDNYLYVTNTAAFRNPLITLGSDIRVVNYEGNRPDFAGGAVHGATVLDPAGKIIGMKKDNLILNAGFHNLNNATTFTDWAYTAGGNCAIDTAPTSHPGPGRAIAFQQAASNDTLTSTLIDVLPYTYYTASIWLKADTQGDAGLRIFDEDNLKIVELHENDVLTTWQKYVFCFKTATTTTQIQFHIIHKDTGTDKIYIYQPSIVQGVSPGEFAIRKPPSLTTRIEWNPGNLIDGAGETKGSITVTGAALGDFVTVSAPYDLQDCIATGYVQASNNVEIRLQNESGGAIDFANGYWHVKVDKRSLL
ncbi:MAG: right-handed parallel beta-helix repeat-containing protein [bacterium]|nr:right-handed parallel beta-helix repeat-containing protein [bacterium]